mgnify:CR=1 FL=1
MDTHRGENPDRDRHDDAPGDANTDIGAHLMGFVCGFAAGMILTLIMAEAMNRSGSRTVVLLGDGELQEGQNYEALQSATSVAEVEAEIESSRAKDLE